MARGFNFLVLSLSAFLLTAMAGFPGETQEDWATRIRALGVEPEEVVRPFEYDEDMRLWAEKQLKGYHGLSEEKQLRALQRALFDPSEFPFQYELEATLTAQEAFRSRRGNCMAFTSLFIALSRSIGLETHMVEVERLPDVDEQNGLILVNRHVVAGYRGSNRVTLYDFYVTSTTPFLRRDFITDLKAIALFHNNLGAEALRADRLGPAEAHFLISTRLAPDWAPGWIGLGVCTARRSEFRKALAIYRKAQKLEPSNNTVHRNMAAAYYALGDRQSGDAALEAAADKTRNPFTLIALANLEIKRRNLSAAASYLRRAHWWYPREPAVLEALSRLAAIRGDWDKAEEFSRRARMLRFRSKQ